jgi:soluble lytic murein transglycosylase
MVILLATCGCFGVAGDARAQQQIAAAPDIDARLLPTRHPALPQDLSQFWLVPPKGGPRSLPQSELANAIRLETESKYEQALAILSSAPVRQGPLGDYAIYYAGYAAARLGRPAEACRTFREAQARNPIGYLVEADALGEAECADLLGDHRAAADIYERLAGTKSLSPDLLMRLAMAAKGAGDREKASAALSRVYYEFPTSDVAPLAGVELKALRGGDSLTAGSERYGLELARAEKLYQARRYSDARAAFVALKNVARDDDRELTSLRIAECDYYLKRPRVARDGVRPYIDQASRQAEALYFYAISARDIGGLGEFFESVRRLVDEFPTQSWTEDALNGLATYYVVQDDDEQADQAFRQLYALFPKGRFAERAGWKIGWRAYRAGRYDEAAAVFERAAADFPRSDYRPSWLYWSGRAHEELKETAAADARYALAATDYLNSYYGRLAVARRSGLEPLRRPGESASTSTGEATAAAVRPSLPPNEAVVRGLLSLELYDQAADELRYAQRTWGDSAVIQATLAWIHHQRGDLRAGINAMKRAYPQYMAAGGESLPADILKILFPVDYWQLIRRYATERNLDAYLMAALIAQESTFDADAKSPANAYGLMQLLPSTARRYAKTLHVAKFSTGMLTKAETNILIGMTYFTDLLKRFGRVQLALASYNAGEQRVSRWASERPGIDTVEFVDDIPFPETQNYVKRIVGTAEDYRRVYGATEESAGAAGAEVRAAAYRPTSPTAAATKRKASATSGKSTAAAAGRTVKKKSPAASKAKAKATTTAKKKPQAPKSES